MNIKNTLLVFLSLFVHIAFAQQEPHIFGPEKLSASINSPYSEINPVLSPDGKTLFFVRENHPENSFGTHNTQDIWFSHLQEDGSWSKAARMPEHVNKNRYNAVFAVFDDGNSILLNGRYNQAGTIWKKRGFSVSHQTENGWSKPKPISVSSIARKNKGQYTTAAISNDGQFLAIGFSKKYNSKKSKLYVSRMKKEGKYKKPKKVKVKGKEVAGPKHVSFLSADGKQLYFSARENIFMVERTDEKGKKWSAPQSLNDSINTKAWESYFSTNSKGTFGYFARNVKRSGSDIYEVKLLEDRPYILVKGRVLISGLEQAPDSTTAINFFVNNEETGSVSYNIEDGSYELRLPFGSVYELKAQAASHKEKSETINGEGLVNYTEVEKDLYLKPILVAKIEGKLLLRSSGTPIPSSLKPKIVVNGNTPDSLILDPINNTYQMWLPYGRDYKVEVLAQGLKAEKENLQLSHIKGYTEISKNLFADKERKAIISGVVFDKKTSKPFSADVPLRIILNDTIEAEMQFNEESSTFTMELPLGTQYVINAKAEGYYPMFETVDLSKEEESVKVLKDLYLAPIEVGQSIRLNNIFFETGKADLKTESYPELDRVVSFLKDNPKMKIEIAGHTDNVGGVALNKKLSADRAKSVEAYIVSQGLEDDRINSKGYGSAKPEADNATELGRSLNRRVEFTILEIVK